MTGPSEDKPQNSPKRRIKTAANSRLVEETMGGGMIFVGGLPCAPPSREQAGGNRVDSAEMLKEKDDITQLLRAEIARGDTDPTEDTVIYRVSLQLEGWDKSYAVTLSIQNPSPSSDIIEFTSSLLKLALPEIQATRTRQVSEDGSNHEGAQAGAGGLLIGTEVTGQRLIDSSATRQTQTPPPTEVAADPPSAAQEWDKLTGDLTLCLADLSEDEFLILSSKSKNYYVQFSARGQSECEPRPPAMGT